MNETVIIAEEASKKIRRVRKAERELNDSVSALSDDIEATFTTLKYSAMDEKFEREKIFVNLRKSI